MRGSQTENGIRLRLSHKTDPVLPAAMVTTFAKAACVNMWAMATTPEPTDQSPMGIAFDNRQIAKIMGN